MAQRNVSEGCSECGDDNEEDGDRCGAADECGPPAADTADGEDDSEGFNALDEGGEERGYHRRSDVRPAVVHDAPEVWSARC